MERNFSNLWLAHLMLSSESSDYLVLQQQDMAAGVDYVDQKITKFLDKNKNKHRYPLNHL